MKEQRSGHRAFAMFLVLLVSSCCATLLLADAANAPDGKEDEIRDLSRIVLSNPIDSAARRKLAGLRRQQQQQRRQALNALAKGLNSYAAHKPQATVPDLTKAIQSQYVLDLANSVLLTPLEDIVAECKKHQKPKTRCPACLDTREAVCRGCGGAGVETCRNCRGSGTADSYTRPGSYPMPGSYPRPGGQSRPGSSGQCRICRGSGCFGCGECAGEGFVTCKRCAPKDGGLGASEREAIEKLIAMAVYLRNGGIDYFTQDALRRSPRLRLDEPKDAPEQPEAKNSTRQ